MEDEMGRSCCMLEKILYAHTGFWGWDDKIKMELKEVGWDGVN